MIEIRGIKSIIFVLFFFIINPFLHSWTKKVNKYFNQADWEIVNGRYEKAIANYLRGINLALLVERQRIWDDLGFAYLKTRKIRKAIEFLEKSLEVQPENYNIRLYLAIAFLLKNKPNPALTHLEKILNDIFFDNKWLALASKTSLLKENGDEVTPLESRRMRKEKGVFLEKKIAKDEIIVHIDAFDERNEALVYFAIGIAYKMKNDFEKARENLLRALEKGYNENEIKWQLMDLYIKEGGFEEALKELDGFKEKEEILFIMGYLSYKKGMIKDAIKFLKNSLLYNKNFILSKENLARIYYNAGKYRKAINLWRELLKETSNKKEIKRNIAFATYFYNLTKNKEIPLVVQIPKRLNLFYKLPHKVRYEIHHRLKNHVNNLLPDINRSFFKKIEQGKILEGVEILKKGLNIDETNYIINHNFALIYFDLGFLEEAEKYGARALWFNKDYIGSYDLMGNIYYKKEEFKKAFDEFKMILKIDSRYPAAHYNLGCVYFSLNDFQNTEKEWWEAIKLEPAYPESYFELGKIYLGKKDYNKALF
ncbi:tetratricopeptide repeat protein [Candidatus Aminicenantes bacterium AH-873-B07]|nr:tetratricopeptide repeat protein [Candidatus Aminicenantes bacterium AH-873-B07]